LPRRDVSLAESVAEFLRTRSTLLVLDNCEHVLDASARLAEMLLQGCPDVRIVATSREGLAVAGEQVFPLRSLPIPGESETAETIAASDAARLFVERAALARAGFVIDSTNVDAVAEICRRLDGIPLAIELAAARVSAMRPRDIAARLGERFRLLTGGRRTAVERHQTLRATVDWSYSLLTGVEQAVFNRLGVFSGGFDITSAEAVASGDGIEQWDVVEGVAGLVDKSMVSDDETPSGAARYTMLETLRQYALERLDDAGDIDGWRRRHAEHFAGIAEELRGRLLGPDELAARATLSVELDNYRAAVNWALERDEAADGELGIRIVSALASQAFLLANASVGAWAELAVPHVNDTTSEQRARILGAAGMAAMARGDHARARELATAAWETGDDEARLSAYPYGALSYSQVVSGEYAESIATLVEAEQLIAEASPDSWDHLHMLMALSSFRAMNPDDSMALPIAEETMRVARLLGSDYMLGQSLVGLGMSLQRGDPARAREAFEEGYDIARRLHHGIFGSLTSYLAIARLRTGDPIGALEALRDAFSFFGDTGDRPQLVAAVNRAVRVTAAVGEQTVAAALVGVANDGPLARLNNFPDSRLEESHPILLGLESDLGREQYAEARHRGAAMNYDEVSDYVVAEIDRILMGMNDR